MLTSASCFDSFGRHSVVVRVGDFNIDFVEDSFEEVGSASCPGLLGLISVLSSVLVCYFFLKLLISFFFSAIYAILSSRKPSL